MCMSLTTTELKEIKKSEICIDKSKLRHIPPENIELLLEKLVDYGNYEVQLILRGPSSDGYGGERVHTLFTSADLKEAETVYNRYEQALKSGEYLLTYDWKERLKLEVK